MTKIGWIATLSDGTTVSEHSEGWEVIPDQPKPWTRLIDAVTQDGRYVTSLAFDYNGSITHLPVYQGSGNPIVIFDEQHPKYYSLCYMAEGELASAFTQKNYVLLTAHFDEYEVHVRQSLDNDERNIFVTRGWIPIKPTPEPK